MKLEFDGQASSQESISCVAVGNNDVERRGVSCLLLSLLSCAGVRLSVLSLARWRNFSTTLRALLFAVSSLLEISVRSVCDCVSSDSSPGYSALASYHFRIIFRYCTVLFWSSQIYPLINISFGHWTNWTSFWKVLNSALQK